jgi:hypothetical protein
MRCSRLAIGLVVVAVGACAPTVDGPVERQRAADRADAERLRAQLTALPGVARAEVIVQRPARDPLATVAPAPAAASLVIVVDDRADRANVETAARALSHAIVPVEPTVVVEVGVERPELAAVGPFRVVASSRGPLKAVLAGALAIIAALAGWIAWSYRRGNSAQ